jgi:hypothetical protein
MSQLLYPARGSYRDIKKDSAGFSFSKGRNKIKIGSINSSTGKNKNVDGINESDEE